MADSSGPLRTLTLDPSVRRAGDGRVLVGGSPLTLMRLTQAGADLVDRIESGADVSTGATVKALVDRLLDVGIVHPRYADGPPPASVTVVIPAFQAPAATLAAIVASCSDAAAVIVVDDASPTPIATVAGAEVVRRETNGGPGAARMTGLARVTTPFVAFVDSDVVVSPGWLDALLGHFHDDRVALVAPRVASAGGAGDGSTRLTRYELVRSPLDLGMTPARVRAGTRVSYVPAAAVVCRVDALDAVGGFDATMRVGEDVDLVWRLDESGWRVRYEPAVVVRHQPRSTLRAWSAQRYEYGSSAAELATRHPGALAPVRVSGWSAASWLAVACGLPIVGASIAAVTTALLARKLAPIPDGPRLAVRLAGLGHLYAGRSLASAMTRAWWPIAAVAAIVSTRARRWLVLAIVVPAALDWRTTRPSLDPASYTALRLLDDVAYGTGLAAGALRERSLDALRPDLTSWPHSRPRPGR